jgi:hypothetical protein
VKPEYIRYWPTSSPEDAVVGLVTAKTDDGLHVSFTVYYPNNYRPPLKLVDIFFWNGDGLRPYANYAEALPSL